MNPKTSEGILAGVVDGLDREGLVIVSKTEYAALEGKLETAVKALRRICEEVSPYERMRGTPNYACRWCYAFSPSPKLVHHSSDCAWNNAISVMRS